MLDNFKSVWTCSLKRFFFYKEFTVYCLQLWDFGKSSLSYLLQVHTLLIFNILVYIYPEVYIE